MNNSANEVQSKAGADMNKSTADIQFKAGVDVNDPAKVAAAQGKLTKELILKSTRTALIR